MLTQKFEPFENKIWLASPTMHGEELAYMKEAFDTNWMSTVGANINEVERLTAEATGTKHAVGLTCGTAALHMAVKLAGIKPGDKVLCSSMTFAATVNPVVYEGGVPVFIDSEYDTWNMSPAALSKAFELYPEAKVVVLVHLYGTPAKVGEIRAICDAHGALLIEDAAESLGATFGGAPTGSFGDFGVVSFNGNKIITGSSGGCLLTESEQVAAKVRKWSQQSRENAPWYQHEVLGYNYRMSNVIAGVVRGQFPHLAEHIAQKKAIYERYRDAFADLPVQMNPLGDTNLAEPNYWLSCMTINPEAMCTQHRTATEATFEPTPGKTCPAEILDALAAINAEGRPIWKPMHRQPIYALNAYVGEEGEMSSQASIHATTSISDDIFARGLCLPSDNKMTAEEQARVIEVVRGCFS